MWNDVLARLVKAWNRMKTPRPAPGLGGYCA
jgi:hypothetical protein